MNDFASVNFDRLSIVLAVHVPPNEGEPVHKNRPSHGFAYCRGKSLIYTFDNGNALTVPPNSLIYLPKNSSYVVSSDDFSQPSIGTFAINFDTTGDLNLSEFRFTPQNSEKAFGFFQEAEIAWRTKSVGYYEKCCKILYDIILTIKQETAANYMPTSKKSIIAPALDYISENYTHENISIAKLSELCGVSEVYMRKIFQNVLGISPIRYINRLKLSRAKELIESGEYTVGTAAQKSGFFDDSYFSREFKKEFGLSPINYFKNRNQF